MDVAVQLEGTDAMGLQLSFAGEREQAARVAAEARSATRDGKVGDALSSWGRLLDEFPYEANLVSEAEREHGLLLQLGLEELAGLRDEFERARFFGLAGLFRELRGQATSLASRYAGSVVEAEARALDGLIATDLTK